jgi:hypothetical protein
MMQAQNSSIGKAHAGDTRRQRLKVFSFQTLVSKDLSLAQYYSHRPLNCPLVTEQSENRKRAAQPGDCARHQHEYVVHQLGCDEVMPNCRRPPANLSLNGSALNTQQHYTTP